MLHRLLQPFIEEPKPPSGSSTNKLAVVTNWFDELKRRALAKQPFDSVSARVHR